VVDFRLLLKRLFLSILGLWCLLLLSLLDSILLFLFYLLVVAHFDNFIENAEVHELEGDVDVFWGNDLGESHLGMGSGETDHCLEGSDSDGDCDLVLVGFGSLETEVGVSRSGVFNGVVFYLWDLGSFGK